MQIASMSRQGRRGQNDDVVFVGDGFVVLADGVGGHAGGQQAAMVAVGAALQCMTARTEQSLVDAFKSANAAVRGYQASTPEHTDAGCTLTVVAVRDNPAVGRQAILGHVGDSSAFLVRDGAMSLLTPPHTAAEHLLREGRITREQSETHPGRHTLQRSVGGGTDVNPEIQIITLEDDDRLVVCSDGLLDLPDRGRLEEILRTNMVVADCAAGLVEAALETSRDNVSVAVISLGAHQDPLAQTGTSD